jgi:hypothetical protein
LRREAAALLAMFGSEGAGIAMARGRGDAADEEAVRFWRDVGRLAGRWNVRLQELDTSSRYLEEARLLDLVR